MQTNTPKNYLSFVGFVAAKGHASPAIVRPHGISYRRQLYQCRALKRLIGHPVKVVADSCTPWPSVMVFTTSGEFVTTACHTPHRKRWWKNQFGSRRFRSTTQLSVIAA